MDLRNSNCTELRNFYFTTIWKLFLKNFQVLPNPVSKKYVFEDIDLQEFHAKLHKKPRETLGED